MKRLIGKPLVGILVVAATAIAATPATAAEGGTDRPFLAAGTGTNIVEPFGQCDVVIDARPRVECDQKIELDFKGTHLGKGTNTSVGVLSVYLYEPCITPGGGPGLRFESFQAVTIVAANGDAITADTNVSGCSDGVTGSEPAGNYTITGGTGRFAGASGSGTIDAEALGASLSNEWVGTISY